MSGRIAALDGGASYHFFALTDPVVAPALDATIDLRGLAAGDLDGFDTVVVPCRSNPALLAEKAEALRAVLARGGMLVVLGETEPDRWLPSIALEPVPTDFWWWREEGTDLGVEIAAPDHPLARHLDRAAATWHVHGLLTPPPGATSVIEWAERRIAALRPSGLWRRAAGGDDARPALPPRQLLHAGDPALRGRPVRVAGGGNGADHRPGRRGRCASAGAPDDLGSTRPTRGESIRGTVPLVGGGSVGRCRRTATK